MNSQSDGEGGVSPPDLTLTGERGQESPCPSTSNCDPISHWPSEDQSIPWRRGENEEESHIIIISDEDDGDYEIPKATSGLSKSPLSPSVRTEIIKPVSHSTAPSRERKPKIPIIPAQPLRRRRRDYYMAQAENIRAGDNGTSGVHQEFQSTSHVHSPEVASTPAVGPSKNVQNAPAPQSIAEQLGFRKPKRRASEQSEDSLDRVKELRHRGRECQVGSKWKAPIPHMAKGINLKLDPQETQFHKQKHDQIHKMTATFPTKQTTPWSPTKCLKKAKHCISEGEKREGDEKKGDIAVDANMQSCDQMSNKNDNDSPTCVIVSLEAHNWNIKADPSPILVDQPEETIQPSSFTQPPALETPTTLHQSGDLLKTCTRSSMTTVKTFTSISRSDSLVKDMEKTPSSQPKTVHQAHMLQPPLPQHTPAQSEVRPHAIIAKITPFPSQADEQAHKPCLEPPPRDKKEHQAEALALPRRPHTSILKAEILKWKYSWFKEYDQFVPPTALCDRPLKLVPQTFSSFMDYYNKIFPLLLTNTFEEVCPYNALY